jgi:hypothetical protein
VKSGVRRWLLAMLLLRLAYKVIGAPPGQGPKPPSKVRKIKWGSIALYLTLLLLSGAFGLGLYLDATASPATPPDGYFLHSSTIAIRALDLEEGLVPYVETIRFPCR